MTFEERFLPGSIFYRHARKEQTTNISVHLDVRNVTGGDNTVQLNLSAASFVWEVTDENGNPVPCDSPAEVQPGILMDQKVILESRKVNRLPLSHTDGAAIQDRAGYMTLLPGQAWSFEKRAKAAYLLRGRITIPFSARGVWYGTIDLPPVQIPVD